MSERDEGEIMERTGSSSKATPPLPAQANGSVDRASRPQSFRSRSRSRSPPRRKRDRYEDDGDRRYRSSRNEPPRRMQVSYADIDRVEERERDRRESDRYDDRKRKRVRSQSPRRSSNRERVAREDSSRKRDSSRERSGSRPRVAFENGSRPSKYTETDAPEEAPVVYVPAWMKSSAESSSEVVFEEPIDEAALIEERRKKREAIKAKYRGQATPLLIQALNLKNGDSDTERSATEPTNVSTAPSPAANGQDTPAELMVIEEADLSKKTPLGTSADSPSAADYDPTVDMVEDDLRESRRRLESNSNNHQVAAASDANGIKSEPEPAKKPEFDMFADEDEDDIFSEAKSSAPHVYSASEIEVSDQSKALDLSMLDDWDDIEGYYRIILGELLDGRYHVQANLGKGMFSGVVRAKDTETGRTVAIKVIRNNETMRRAGQKEIDLLERLMLADPEDKKHVIRLVRQFEHKSHLCMVFENMSINLREVLKKFGRDEGLNLAAVRTYAQQMFLGLSLLQRCNIIHADLKPDNVLVSENRNLLKICDLGSASDASENEITPYLVSRFYRAPEIILGLPYDFAIDMWSVGCTLYELCTGKILFTGRSNNQMLKSIMDCRGKFSHKLLRRAQFAYLHFDDALNFHSLERDKTTDREVTRVINVVKPTRDLRAKLNIGAKGMTRDETEELTLFANLLDRCLNLNPEKRITPADALKHPFILRPVRT